jgi:plasmid stabilization system protein ParE
MARVVVTRAAQDDLDRLIRTYRLPSGTRDRVRRTLQPLREFPELGANLGDSFRGYRFVLGPWRWMIVIYRFDEADDLVAVMAIVDGRTSSSPTANR